MQRLRTLGARLGRHEFKFVVNGEWESGDNRILPINLDGQIEHLAAGVQRDRAGVDLSHERLVGAEQQLLTLRSSALQNDVTLYVALGGGLRETGAASTVPASG